MKTKLTTAPTEYAVSVCEVKDHCRIDGTDEDTYLANLIQQATEFIQRATGMQLTKATYTQTVEDKFPTEFRLDWPPAYSVTSIQYYDTDGVLQTLAADQYYLDNNGLIGIIEPAYDVTWPSTRALPNSVVVTYIAGYDVADIPLAAKRAVLFTVAHWYEHREAVTVGMSGAELPMAVQNLIYQLMVSEVI